MFYFLLFTFSWLFSNSGKLQSVLHREFNCAIKIFIFVINQQDRSAHFHKYLIFDGQKQGLILEAIYIQFSS